MIIKSTGPVGYTQRIIKKIGVDNIIFLNGFQHFLRLFILYYLLFDIQEKNESCGC